MQVIEGAYSLLVMSPRKLIAVRDPHGFRPLCMGKYNDSYVFASESAALDACGAEFVRDVEPGEIVIVDQNGVRSMKPDFGDKKKALCIFEYIYFARSDSFIDGVSVYEARKQAGRILQENTLLRLIWLSVFPNRELMPQSVTAKNPEFLMKRLL